MGRPIARSFAVVILAAFVIGCCAVVAQSQRKEQKLDPAVLAEAPAVPQMLVDSVGTLHLGSPTVPPPAFLLSGTRDMCLSQSVLQHRKLRAAGVPRTPLPTTGRRLS
ncbi:MAG TPA: hypothetical protein VMS37_22935 [Verrucomicrobiae bacterium]|nr:hypothetical protein [Verrucomicrobiae bacterium]